MPIKVTCQCGAKFVARDQLAGKDVECVACGATLRVPTQSAGGGGGGGGAGQVVSLLLLGAAVVACGVMLYLQHERIEDLRSQLARRVGELKSDLEGATKANQETAVEVQQGKDRLEGLQADLNAEAKAQETLRAALSNLDMEAVRIRNNLQRVEQERQDAQAAEARASAAKAAEYDRQLATLSADLGRKANEADAARLRGEIQRVEQERASALAAVSSANLSARAGLDAQIANLQGELRRKTAEQDDLSTKLSEAKSKVDKLEKDALSIDPTLIPKQLEKIQAQLDASRPEAAQTVVGEDQTTARRLLFSLDTRTGRVEYVDYSLWPKIVWFSNDGTVAAQEPGRFELQMTFDDGDDVYDVIRLDTVTGDIWQCDCRGGAPFVWTRVPVQTRVVAKPGERWRMGVSTLGASASGLGYPVLVVTAPNGEVYDDSIPGLSRRILLRQ